ncbi:MAG: glycosyltransferase family 2 protein [Deltaproteobacteria bacterium]|nr:glycosyltransferase family 2 protein [Deltaproteobacteria bacterium]
MPNQAARSGMISLVFPMFDEEQNVGPLLASALALAPRLADAFEIIVVDDGSRDGSAAVVERQRRLDPRVRLLRHPTNVGYGAALRSGLRAARGDLVFFTDADLQFDLREIESLLAHARDFDIVAGYRARRRDPWRRRVLAFGWAALVRALFGLRVRDIDCAFKVFRRPVLDALPIESIGAFVNTELLLRARGEGFRIREVPVTHHPRFAGRAKGATPRVIGRALVELATLYRELRAAAESPPAAWQQLERGIRERMGS